MTDLEITRKCAERMGIECRVIPGSIFVRLVASKKDYNGVKEFSYAPLYDDAQAMALVKKFSLRIDKFSEKAPWLVIAESGGEFAEADNHNLNRAICECVANLKGV